MAVAVFCVSTVSVVFVFLSTSELTFGMSTALCQAPLQSCKNSLKIPKGQSEFLNQRRTDNTMAKIKGAKTTNKIYKTYGVLK